MGYLSGRRVLLVGGSSGIGLAAARKALREGAIVSIASRSADKLAKAATELDGLFEAAELDARDAAAVETFFAERDAFHHIVVSAAQTQSGRIHDFPLEDAYASMDSKFWNAWRIARFARIAQGGTLTLVSGLFSVRPAIGHVLQGAINAALEGLVRGLALELAPIRVNAVSPGYVDTPIRTLPSEADRLALNERIAAGLPAGIAGEGAHVAIQIAAFWDNPYQTGSVVYLDGGGALV